jgi:non-canonical purine NTP pyrophosphatase (RdgB/HAM1 family)
MAEMYLVTHNKNKLVEFRELLSLNIDVIDLDIDEIQALDVEQVAISKAKAAHKLTGKFVVVEDTGLYIDAWNGLPGALTRWFLESLGIAGICKVLQTEKNRKCFIKTVLVIYGDNTLEIFTGRLDGEILYHPKGDNGFGFDAIVKPVDSQKSIAEMSTKEKNALSTRRKVIEQFERYVKNQL